jgi:hypothetical protein
MAAQFGPQRGIGASPARENAQPFLFFFFFFLMMILVDGLREIYKNETVNIGLCSFDIGPIFHRHRWSYRVINWKW